MEALAITISQQCVFGHIPNFNTDNISFNIATFADPASFNKAPRGIGENLAYSTQEPNLNVLTDLTYDWIEEGHFYGYGAVNGDNITDPGEANCTNAIANGNDTLYICGHFTQV